MIYKVISTEEADLGFARLAKNEPKAFEKALLILTAYGHYDDK